MNGSGKKKTTSGRMIVTFLLIMMQVAWLFLLVSKVSNNMGWISNVFQITSIILALYIVNKDDVTAYRMGWVLMIIIAPVFGGLMYLVWGDKRSSIFMRRKLDRGMEGIQEYVIQKPEVEQAFRKAMPRAAGCAHYLSDCCGFPVWQNTSVKYHSLGDYQFTDMLRELKNAEKFIFIEYFIIEEGVMWNSIFDILCEKVQQGVDVRVIYDDFGCLSKLPTGYDKNLEAMGIKCLRFNPFIPIIAVVMNNRDHRKMLIIDGNVAFTGGLNLADEYINHKRRFGHWKDSGLMLRGQAVWNFTAMFLEMWTAFRPENINVEQYMPHEEYEGQFAADGFVQPFFDSPFDYETVSVNLYTDIIYRANDYIFIFTPYLAISEEMSTALRTAAKRGVDVRLVIPGIPDKKLTYRITRSYTIPLLQAGVRVYEYTPGFLHSKSYVCDDETAIVGTINSDYRSLYLQFECGVLMSGNQAVLDVRDDALRTFEVAHEVTIEEREKTGLFGYLERAFDSVLKLLAPLF